MRQWGEDIGGLAVLRAAIVVREVRRGNRYQNEVKDFEEK